MGAVAPAGDAEAAAGVLHRQYRFQREGRRLHGRRCNSSVNVEVDAADTVRAERPIAGDREVSTGSAASFILGTRRAIAIAATLPRFIGFAPGPVIREPSAPFCVHYHVCLRYEGVLLVQTIGA